MLVDSTNLYAFLAWCALSYVVCLAIAWYIGEHYYVPSLRTWCRCRGYQLLSYRVSFYDLIKYAFCVSPHRVGGYYRVKVAEESGKSRKAVVCLGKKDVWVFWPDTAQGERVGWEELLRGKHSLERDLLE